MKLMEVGSGGYSAITPQGADLESAFIPNVAMVKENMNVRFFMMPIR